MTHRLRHVFFLFLVLRLLKCSPLKCFSSASWVKPPVPEKRYLLNGETMNHVDPKGELNMSGASELLFSQPWCLVGKDPRFLQKQIRRPLSKQDVAGTPVVFLFCQMGVSTHQKTVFEVYTVNKFGPQTQATVKLNCLDGLGFRMWKLLIFRFLVNQC